MCFKRTLVINHHQLNKGADSARADDAASLKPEVIHWLMSLTPSPEPALRHCEKDGRGFHHDVTGRLLCPVDYEWGDLECILYPVDTPSLLA